MAHLDDAYLRFLTAHSEETVSAIIRTTISPTEASPKLRKLGCTVTQSFTLISAVAATAPAATFLKLQSVEWISHIEPDCPVHTTN